MKLAQFIARFIVLSCWVLLFSGCSFFGDASPTDDEDDTPLTQSQFAESGELTNFESDQTADRIEFDMKRFGIKELDVNELERQILEREQEKKPIDCAEPQIFFARELQTRAKDYLHDYYRRRTTSSIYFAWYALEDSNFVLAGVQRCADKTNKHFHAVQNLKRQNESIAKFIAINGRGRNYVEYNEIYLDEYNRLFPRDIR